MCKVKLHHTNYVKDLVYFLILVFSTSYCGDSYTQHIFIKTQIYNYIILMKKM